MLDVIFLFKEKAAWGHDWILRAGLSPITKFNHAVSDFNRRKKNRVGILLIVQDKYTSSELYSFALSRTVVIEGYHDFGLQVYANGRYFNVPKK